MSNYVILKSEKLGNTKFAKILPNLKSKLSNFQVVDKGGFVELWNFEDWKMFLENVISDFSNYVILKSMEYQLGNNIYSVESWCLFCHIVEF